MRNEILPKDTRHEECRAVGWTESVVYGIGRSAGRCASRADAAETMCYKEIQSREGQQNINNRRVRDILYISKIME